MPPPRSTTQGQLAVMVRTTDLYRSCMGLAAEGRSLMRENEGMKRLGLNAQVMAVHTGAEGGSLEVIVAEIGRLSASIREVLDGIVALVPRLNDLSIATLHRSHLRASYLAGAEQGIGGGNEERYRLVLERLQEDMNAGLGCLERDLESIGALLSDLERIASRIPPVASLIRIVVAEIRQKSEELLGTVSDLVRFHALLEEKIGRMRQICRRAQGRIEEMREGQV